MFPHPPLDSVVGLPSLNSNGAEYISRTDLNTIATGVKGQWQRLGIKLKLDQSTVLELHDRHPNNSHRAALEMLKTWRKMLGDGATRRVLKKALLELNFGCLATAMFPHDLI